MSDSETIEVLDSEEQNLLPAVADTRSLVPAQDPAEFIVKASEIAKALANVIEDRKLYKDIGAKRHVLYEGWTFLGSMMGAFGQAVFAVEEWTREYKDPETGQVIGWEARVVARTADGRDVGAADSMCTRKENRWARADDYAIRSMAQTRAASKALRQPLGFIVQLAGYETTPLEEMPQTDVPETRVEGPRGLPLPKTWAKVTEMVSAYDEKTHDLFMAFAKSASKLRFGESDGKKLTAENRKEALALAARAALALREAVDPAKFPPPTIDDVRRAWASVLDGQELAIEGEED